MAARRPPRGSHPPNTFWYYNNWDFNTLNTIFEQETGTGSFEEFRTRIADPLQMQDYRLRDGYYHLEPEHSNHPAYPFRMSARDMARFGLLLLYEGRWGDRQLIPSSWDMRERLFIEIAEDGTRELIAEALLNEQGYAYLEQGDVERAIEIFKRNVEHFPESWNAYDSLAEAYGQAGDLERAIENYRRSLDLNPDNAGAVRALERLGASST